MPRPKTEKQSAVLAWNTATNDRKLSPLLKAIGAAIKNSPCEANSFLYAHRLGAFSKKIASSKKHGGPACLDYCQDWSGKWTVTNADLDIFTSFRMWLDRYLDPRYEESIISGRIAKALKRKRLQQAFNRYQKTGLRKEHVKLVAGLLWEVDTNRGDWISVFVQGKRPLGDSARAQSIYLCVGWPTPWLKKDGEMTVAETERAWNLLDELPFALPHIANRVLAKFPKTNE